MNETSTGTGQPMTTPPNENGLLPKDYCGRILTGTYSDALKKRVANYIRCYQAFDRSGNPAIPYISAWIEGAKEIWYEFTGRRMIKALRCEPGDVARIFRESVSGRRIYEYRDPGSDVHREDIDRKQLSVSRRKIREGVKQKGITEAVYKLSFPKGQSLWLKDLARVERHEADNIYLSLGNLTILSKEIRAEEERLKKQRLQVSLETAGAVCHELNQCIQTISGYSEILSDALSSEDPMGDTVRRIADQAGKMGSITNRLQHITSYKTKDYLRGIRILDIEESSK
ncbi:MAG: hypothetical protein JRK53_20300 [Deltaproteobacteria bacterium]|nr:hypothetical protein [Deltaproteobacteria bacterium]